MAKYHIEPRKLTLNGNALLVTPATRGEMVAFRASGEGQLAEEAGYAMIRSHVTFADGTPLDLDELPQADLIALLQAVMGVGKAATLPDFTNTP